MVPVMGKRACVVLLGSLFCTSTSGARPKPPAPGPTTASLTDGDWEYRFDEAAISKADLRAWLDFSERSELRGARCKQSAILNARKQAKAGGGWEAWSSWGPEWVRRSRAETAAARAKLAPLEEMKVPAELEPARRFVIDECLLHQEIELVLLEVVEKNDTAPLADRPLPGVDARAACADAVKKVGGQTSREDKLHAGRFEWSNCVIQRVGKYPTAAWKAFLRRYRVTETRETANNE
jgi:hypothetical protein